MWVTAFCLCLIMSGVLAEDNMLAILCGEQGLNRMVICRAGREECEGALLSGEWVVARPGCVRRHRRPPAELRVLARWSPEKCEDIVSGLEMYLKSMALGVYSNNARRVRNRLIHPTLDFGLIRVDRPYQHMDKLVNGTSVDLIFQQNGLWKWMNRIFQEHATADGKAQVPTFKFRLNSNPFLLCFMSIVLPFALFALLFVYVIFYTGAPDEPQYMNHQYLKESVSNNLVPRNE